MPSDSRLPAPVGPSRRARRSGVAALILLAASPPAPARAQEPAAVQGTVRHAATGAPLAGATIQVVPGSRSCVTSGSGRCRLAVDAGERQVRAVAVGFAPVTRSVALAPGQSVSLDFDLAPSAVPLEELVTVGTRALERTTGRSPVPTDVYTRQSLDETGLVETWQQLQRLAPSANVPRIPFGDNQLRPVTLRGMLPHHVLVLVNGKRRHPASVLLAGPAVAFAAFTDLGAIPNSAIERIEVLRDGAAAQYGSDAIGGVVNVVLKSGARSDLRTSAGVVSSSEGGRTFDDGHLVSAATTLGLGAANGSYVTFSGELRDRGGTNRAYPDRRQQYFTGDPRNDAPPRVSSYLGDGAGRDALGFLTAALPVTGRVEAYLMAGAAARDGESPDAFFRRPLDPRTVRAIHPDGFLPVVESRIRDLSAVAGLRGTWRGWRWDASAGWGGNRVDYDVRHSNNVSLGAASPTDFYAGRFAASQWTGNVDVSRHARIGSVPLGIAAGAEVRVDGYRIRAGEPDSWRDGGVPILDGPAAGQPAAVGSQGLIGLRPLDEVTARRTSAALYVEVEGRPRQRLQLQAAVRAEHFSDFGSTSNGKVAGRFAVTRWLALRASVGTGFRAPALSQQYFASTRTFFQPVGGVNTVLTVRTFPVGTPEARLLGAAPLRPEKALISSAGLVLDAPRWPLVSVDLFQVDLRDRIGLGATVTDTSLIRLFEENGMRGIGGGNFFANAVDVRTRGIEVVAQYALLHGRTGVLRLTGGYTRMANDVVRVAPTPPPLAALGAVFTDRMAIGVIERGQPRETISLGANYATGPLGFTLDSRRAGPTAQRDRTRPDADQVVRARWITNARIAWRFRPRLQLAVSVANLFDAYPDEWNDFKDGLLAQGPSMQGIFRYPGGLSPFGMNGRTVYVHLDYR